MMFIKVALLIIIGLSGGLAVGSGFVAFLTLLGVAPRLTQLTKTKRFIRHYTWALVIGAQVGTWISMYNLTIDQSRFLLIPIGLLAGMFIGMLAAALTEVLNVIPILSKRIGMYDRIAILLMALALGKVFGSLFQWLFYE